MGIVAALIIFALTGLAARFFDPADERAPGIYLGSSGFLVDVRPTPAPSCSFCGTGIDHCAL